MTEIKVTQEMIDEARRRGMTGSELIAMAITKAIPEATDISVNEETISYTLPGGEVHKELAGSELIAMAITKAIPEATDISVNEETISYSLPGGEVQEELAGAPLAAAGALLANVMDRLSRDDIKRVRLQVTALENRVTADEPEIVDHLVDARNALLAAERVLWDRDHDLGTVFDPD